MERIEKTNNITKYYLDDNLLLSITDLGENNYIVENRFNRLEGYCKTIDDYRIESKLNKNYKKLENGKMRNIKRLFSHNQSWFNYILMEKGFQPKIKAIY